MEKILIKNFAGIKEIELEANTINLIIGPQASGKSIIVKLLFFFKSFFTEIKQGIEDKKSKRQIDSEQLNKFINFFPKDTWPDNDFVIKYTINDSELSIKKTAGKKNIKFIYSDNIKSLLTEARRLYNKEVEKQSKSEKLSHFNVSIQFSSKFNNLVKEKVSSISIYNQIFIPAGRSFFSNIQASIFSFLSSNKSLDPFLIQFGSIYENFKRIANDDFMFNPKRKHNDIELLINSILNSNYLREKEKDYLVHPDKRKVNLFNASSGQQEILPLLIILNVLRFVSFSGEGAVLYIEEPEAHLFPDAQKKIVSILSNIFNSKNNNFQYFITTHSPYILASFNNLMYAGYLENISSNINKTDIYKIVSKEEILDPGKISAFSITSNKKIISAINPETELIDQNLLDEVSDVISQEFENLMNLE